MTLKTFAPGAGINFASSAFRFKSRSQGSSGFGSRNGGRNQIREGAATTVTGGASYGGLTGSTENAYSELLDAPEPPRLLHSPN
jgi:hypothetical protein